MIHLLETVLRKVRDTWIEQGVNDITDAELLHRFVHQHDAAAFELLLRRHERMVFAVCRHLTQDVTDAEDVFQTTFLALVCKAGTIARADSVAAWLHQVACRAARRAVARRASRLRVERPTPDLPAIAVESNALALAHRSELAPMLHEELSKLPDKYRAPLVLCYLEGKTYAEGALQLGCPLGTLSIRLKRGRDLLRKRLQGRGFALTAGGLATALSEQATSAATAGGLVDSILTAGLRVAGGSALGDVVSPQTAALTESLLQTMSTSKLKLVTAALVFVLGIGLAVRGWATAQPTPATPPEKPAPVEPARGAVVDDSTFAIRGRVVDRAAKPIAGAMVRLLAPGPNSFDVDEKTTTDGAGRFALAAPKLWTRMDISQRQNLSLVAVEKDRIGCVQFNRTSAPPPAEVELTLSSAGGEKIEILSPDLRPVAGARVKITGLIGDLIHVGLTEAQEKQLGASARKTPIGHVLRTDTVSLPPDLEVDIGTTDARGLATVSIGSRIAGIGSVSIQTDEFGEQIVGHFGFNAKRPPNWARRIVLKRTGRVVGQLSGPTAGAGARREVMVHSSEFDQATGMFHGSKATIVTDREGKFEATKLAPGAVQFTMKFDAAEPNRAVHPATRPQLKAGQTLSLKIELKRAVRVEGRVLEAGTREPIRDVQVRALFSWDHELATSDAEGKFSFWMAPGETVLHPSIPEEYLSPLAPSDYFDSAKRQQTQALFEVPPGKTFQAPPILLHRALTLRGTVLDDRGQALTGAQVSGLSMVLERRTGEPKSREVAVKTDERGEFAITGIDPREPVRLRVSAREASKVVTITRPGSEAVRIVMAPKEAFRISGRVVDVEGKPVADPVLEIWHRDWQPPPHEAAPKKMSVEKPIRGDASGRFETPPLVADGHYRFTIRAASARTTESAWLDASKPDTAKPQQFVVTRLAGLSGVVRDRMGKPIADAQISLVTRETRTETASNRQGQFELEVPAGKPFCVVVRHPDFRVEGAHYDKAPASLDQTMVRLTEPSEKLAPRRLLARDERAKMLTQVFEPFKKKLAKHGFQEKVSALQSLTGVAPDFVTELLDKDPIRPVMYDEMLRTQVAMKRASHNAEEAEELIGKLKQGAQQSMAYGMLVDALPEKARARKQEILAEALVAARAEKSPEFRAIALGQVAKRLWMLGDRDRATPLLREGEKIAQGLSTSAFAGYARGSFATDLALIDLPAALALMKGLKDRRELARHHGNTAHRIAATRPAEAVKVLNLLPPPGQNEFNQRDQYAIRVCYRTARADLRGAVELAGSIIDVPSRAYALGVIAHAVAKTEPKQATDLVRRAFVLLEEDAARPDSPQLTGPQPQGAIAAALLLLVEDIDAGLVRECQWRSVLLARQHTDHPHQIWRYSTGNSALAMAVGRYQGKLAEFLVPAEWAPMMSRGGLLAEFLANPQRAVAAAEKAGMTKDNREVLLITYLSTEEERIGRLILSTLGIWRIDVEDIEI